MNYLDIMRQKFEQIKEDKPKARHLIKNGDTLQTLSVKYYGSVDSWNKIKNHNKLTSTELEKNTVIEIPK
jgi:nucleoid-associated protein YgaU